MAFSSSSSSYIVFRFLLVWLLLGGLSIRKCILTAAATTRAGINYGRMGNNLPPPTQVAAHLKSLNYFTKVRIYDADPEVLAAFANTSIELTVEINNKYLLNMAAGGPPEAAAWLKQHILPFLPHTRITGIIVGNEVYSTNDTALISNLLPALQSVHGALVALGLDKQVTISTTHALTAVTVPVYYPMVRPSSVRFNHRVAPYMKPLLDFLSDINSPFLLNASPYLAYQSSTDPSSLLYATFLPEFSGFTDPKTNITYCNFLYGQIDQMYAAMEAMGHTNIRVVVSETGWPTDGDTSREDGADKTDASSFTGYLLKRIGKNETTPLKPSFPVAAYISSLFNENLKLGLQSQRNYGLFHPNFEPVYKFTNLPDLKFGKNCQWIHF